jgi:hypothetical protein
MKKFLTLYVMLMALVTIDPVLSSQKVQNITKAEEARAEARIAAQKKVPKDITQETLNALGPTPTSLLKRVNIPKFVPITFPPGYRYIPEGVGDTVLLSMLAIFSEGVTPDFKDLSRLVDKEGNPVVSEYRTIFLQTVVNPAGKPDAAKLRMTAGLFKTDMAKFVTTFDAAMKTCGLRVQDKGHLLTNKGFEESIKTKQCIDSVNSAINVIVNSEVIYTQTYVNFTSPIRIAYAHLRDIVPVNIRSHPTAAASGAKRVTQTGMAQAFIGHEAEIEAATEPVSQRVARLKAQSAVITKKQVTGKLMEERNKITAQQQDVDAKCKGKGAMQDCMKAISSLEQMIEVFNTISNKAPDIASQGAGSRQTIRGPSSTLPAQSGRK